MEEKYVVRIGNPYDMDWWIFDSEKKKYISDIKGNILKNIILSFESEEDAQELADALNQRVKAEDGDNLPETEMVF